MAIVSFYVWFFMALALPAILVSAFLDSQKIVRVIIFHYFSYFYFSLFFSLEVFFFFSFPSPEKKKKDVSRTQKIRRSWSLSL